MTDLLVIADTMGKLWVSKSMIALFKQNGWDTSMLIEKEKIPIMTMGVNDNFVEDIIRGYSPSHVIINEVHANKSRFTEMYTRWIKEGDVEYTERHSNWHKQPKTYYAAKKNAGKPKHSALLSSLVALTVPA